MDIVFSPLPQGETCEMRVKPGFPTACWSFRPPHVIFVGDGIGERAISGLDPDGVDYYIQSHVHHEWAHKTWTVRDLRQVRKDLAKRKVPFSLFNLFEDARIEERYRVATERLFRWWELEPVAPKGEPGSLLFLMIQTENDQERARGYLAAIPPPVAGAAVVDVSALFDEVWAEFYQPMLEVATSEDLYPLLEKWVARFPGQSATNPGRGNEKGEAGEQSDLETSEQMQADPAFAQSFAADAIEVPDGAAPQDKSTDMLPGGKGEKLPDNHVAETKNGNVLASSSMASLDTRRVDRLVPKFRKLFVQKSRTVRSEEPSKRISVKHFVLERPPFVRKELLGKAKRKVELIVDCSGSMAGHHISEARVLVSLLSALARERMVEGHVILSAVIGYDSVWQSFRLPLANEVTERIHGFAGAEGLEYAMTANEKSLRDADFVMVYTDGQICDKPIDKARWHRKGVTTWGLYAGEDECRESLLKFFDKAVVRANVEAIVDAMLAAR